MPPPFEDNFGTWHSTRVDEEALLQALAAIEADGGYELKFVIPLSTEVRGASRGFLIIARDREPQY